MCRTRNCCVVVMILHVMLGTACNWKCKYCIQLKQAGFPQKMDESFCTKLGDFISANGIEVDRIEYWGGEPCLYFDQIKRIEETIGCDSTRPSRFVTNGSLLTGEMVDFINERNMFVNLSYHEGQLSDTGWETALHIKRLHVTSLIHAKCLTWDPYFSKWQWVQKEFGRCVPWYVFNLYNVENVGQYCLTKEHIDRYIDYLNGVMPLAKINVFFETAFRALFNVEFGQERNHACACFNSDVLSIDTRGNQYICHHACDSRFSVGNIFEKGVSNLKLNTLKPQCVGCKLVTYCNGGCMRESNDTSCYFLHKLFELKQRFEEQQ